jgi:hypothetical protein
VTYTVLVQVYDTFLVPRFQTLSTQTRLNHRLAAEVEVQRCSPAGCTGSLAAASTVGGQPDWSQGIVRSHHTLEFVFRLVSTCSKYNVRTIDSNTDPSCFGLERKSDRS